MKNLIFFSFILYLITFTTCSTKTANNGDIFTIDLSKKYVHREIHLQNIANIEYIPLETTDDVLLGQISLVSYISDNYILVYDLMRGDIFVFNRNGKIISHFNRIGQGGEEYTRIGGAGVIFDEKNEEIFVGTNMTNRILVYSVSGEYKRTLKYSADLAIWEAYNFDDETLLVYHEFLSSSSLTYSYSCVHSTTKLLQLF